MHQKYLSLLRDELYMSRLSAFPREIVEEFHKLYIEHMGRVTGHHGASGMFLGYLAKYIDDADMLLRLRLAKAILSGSCSPGSVDEALCRLVETMVSFYKWFLTAQFIGGDGRIVVRVIHDFRRGGRIYRRGSLVAIGVDDAFRLSAAGIVEPVRSIVSARLIGLERET